MELPINPLFNVQEVQKMGMIINPYRFASESYPLCLNANTIAWFIASELSTITKDGSNLVSLWKDILNSGNDLSQSTDTNKPIWSSDGITFNGSDNYMKTAALTYNQPFSFYAVLKQITWTADDFLITSNITNVVRLYQVGTTPNIRLRTATGSINNNNLNVDTFGIIRVVANGISSKLQINNTPASTGNLGTAAMGGITIGTRGDLDTTYSSNICVKEAIFRTVADDSINETAIYNYLATKYSIS